MQEITSQSLVSTCDTSVVFAGIPANAGAEVKINTKQFIPSPFVSLSVEKYLAGNHTIGGVWKITLSGTVVGDSFNEVSAEIKEILELGSSPLDSVRHTSDCVTLDIHCSGLFIDGAKGRILSVSASEGNQPSWVNMAPYTIELEIYTNNNAPVVPVSKALYPGSILPVASPAPTDLFLKSFSESFSLAISEETFNWDQVPGGVHYDPSLDPLLTVGNQHVKVSFNIAAAGINNTDCVVSGDYGLLAAETIIAHRIKKLITMNLAELVGSGGLPSTLAGHLTNYAGGEAYLQFRTINVDTMEDSLSVTGDIIYRPSGCQNPDIFTTLTVEESMDNEGRSVTISGSVKGLINQDYGSIINGVVSGTGAAANTADLLNTGPRGCEDAGRMAPVNLFLSGLNAQDLLFYIAIDNEHRTAGWGADPTTGRAAKDYLPIPSNCADNLGAAGVYASCLPSPSASTIGPDLCDMSVISSNITRNYGEGTGSFNFQLSNKQNCSIIGARRVEVEITRDKPKDTVAEIVIPGRGSKGSIVQNICCKSAEKCTININATLNTNNCNFKGTGTMTGVKACVDNMLTDLEIEQAVNCWFIIDNQESQGNSSYKVNRQYIKPSCP
jgi:hypothetical protein